MTQIPYADTNGRLTVEVQLRHAADVFLVDSNNYRKLQSGQRYTYFGGHYKQTPVTITVEGAGRWYLIVRGGGQYNYRFY
ncbi:DUF1883 domain-containing protein [Bacillus thuringiensis]|uniref:DUF1883 domain-containing protein n=1 Tax=Bacillus cereus group TaxID=86661 RepID=UPI000279B3A1|nr:MULTISPECIES: DUF1883 domain-containing protein [Bacillus cereus group]EJR88135.1 hypothetical protein IKA_04121 [Bacillus cereus VD169]MEC3599085.1 DUF1883 domain-containing protein [Bacillus thuringiensis]MED1838097.1 DUF1883 domain-containing protein [Bacillus thuringiensis]MED2668330.1 DUF1883 domain-containing protein [Bacillus thuringiensis]MED2697603.1 DUF1883 domain-containing protein [Bacillus thuringiensis]